MTDQDRIHALVLEAVAHLEAQRPDEVLALLLPLQEMANPPVEFYPLIVTAYRMRGVQNNAPADQDEALRIGRDALIRRPGDEPLRALMLEFLVFLRHHEEALAIVDELLVRRPGDPELGVQRATLLQAMMRSAEAESQLDDLARRYPNHRAIATTRCMLSLYRPDCTPAQQLAIHRQFGQVLSRLSPQRPGAGARLRSGAGQGGDRIRIGFVSGDFKRHSVAYFLLPLLTHLDRARFEVTCLSVMTTDDEFTSRFRSLADRFVDVTAMEAPALAGEIRRAGIDVLVDLAGHTTGSRLGAFHLRPAPIQITWLGYPATTGLEAFAARFVDSTTDPAGSEVHGVERLVRLDPCFLCYEPVADAPEPVRHADAGHAVVFGSFNNTRKINDVCLDFWGEVLGASPVARLLLKSEGFAETSLRARVIDGLARRGVDPSRVECHARNWDTGGHLAMYGRVDIGLDTVPYNGTTTTCEALWMGVPTVTFAGDRHMARVGASVLRAGACGEWVGADQSDAVRIATRLAAQGARDAAQRRALREKVAASALCDARSFASRWTDAVMALVEAARAAVKP